LVIGAADFIQPERHDLHKALRTGSGNGEAVKIALHVDQGQYQFRVEPGTC
jgi:hypothetical protein